MIWIVLAVLILGTHTITIIVYGHILETLERRIIALEIAAVMPPNTGDTTRLEI